MSILRTSATKSTSWSKSSAPANRASEAEGCQRQLRASGAAGAATERRRPEIEHGPTGGARESKQASGLGWLGRGRRGPVCLRSKSLNSLCTQSHAASMSPLMPSPSRRAGISCGRGCERDDGWSKPFSERLFFIPPFPLSFHLVCPSSISAPSSTMSFGALPHRPSMQPYTPSQCTTH